MLTANRLREVLDYDPQTGIFTRAGKRAGSSNGCGYLRIRVDGQRYLAHRLAWLHVHGVWPSDQIDHVNTDRADNRIANLRDASRSQNHANTPLSRANTSGFKGVYWAPHTARWRAAIKVNGKKRHLGYFYSANDAALAYEAAANKMFGEFARAA
jgi:hypothetical protein